MFLTAVIVAVVIAIVAVFGLGPRGGKQVANTHMMTVARGVLLVLAAVLLFIAART